MARKLNHTSPRKRTAQPPDLPKTFAQLSSGRRKLFRPVLENPRGYVLLSARQLARRLGVDPATAVRVTMKLGFSNYREFQHYLHELSVSQATSLDTLQRSEERRVGKEGRSRWSR